MAIPWHITPASSKCEQSWFPQPLKGQSERNCSCPVQLTSSIHICTPKWPENGSTVKQNGCLHLQNSDYNYIKCPCNIHTCTCQVHCSCYCLPKPNWPPWVPKPCDPLKPNCSQTTVASRSFQWSSQTVPHCPLCCISTRPSIDVDPPTRRTRSPWREAVVRIKRVNNVHYIVTFKSKHTRYT